MGQQGSPPSLVDAIVGSVSEGQLRAASARLRVDPGVALSDEEAFDIVCACIEAIWEAGHISIENRARLTMELYEQCPCVTVATCFGRYWDDLGESEQQQVYHWALHIAASDRLLAGPLVRTMETDWIDAGILLRRDVSDAFDDFSGRPRMTDIHEDAPLSTWLDHEGSDHLP